MCILMFIPLVLIAHLTENPPKLRKRQPPRPFK